MFIYTLLTIYFIYIVLNDTPGCGLPIWDLGNPEASFTYIFPLIILLYTYTFECIIFNCIIIYSGKYLLYLESQSDYFV